MIRGRTARVAQAACGRLFSCAMNPASTPSPSVASGLLLAASALMVIIVAMPAISKRRQEAFVDEG